MDRYVGRKVVVTGAAKGLGLAMALRFAAEGAHVVVCDVDAEALTQAQKDIDESARAPVRADLVDVADSAQVTRWAADVLTEGPVDVLVNNAGIIRDGLLTGMSDDDWAAVLGVSLNGMFHCTRAYFAAMSERSYGRILSLSSMCWRGNYGQANYVAAKAGVVGLSRTIALEGARRNVTSNVIAPGVIATPMLASLTDKARDRLVSRVPLGRAGDPQDIAEAAAFLCSAAAGYVTGVVLDVDGGAAIGASLR